MGFFMTSFTSGNKQFFIDLWSKLKQNCIQGGCLSDKKRGYSLAFSRCDSLALYKLMYNNEHCSIYLERKKKIFEKAFKVLGYI